MHSTIEKLRARPKEDRSFIAAASSFGVIGVLLLGWGISTLGFFSPATGTAQTAAAANAVPSEQAALPPSDQSAASSSVKAGNAETGAIVTIPAAAAE